MQKWSLCMIVKNEETVLERCLDGLRGLFDEIVVTDTGSSDGTVDVAKRFADRVLTFEWCDDFAAARNFAFKSASGDYLMWLDADDVVPEETRHILYERKREGLSADVVMMPYETAFDGSGRAVFGYYRERLIRNCESCRWVGAVHEVIVPFGRIEYLDAPIRHIKMGRGDPDRNLRIYERLIAEGRQLDARQMYYYGRELADHGRYGEAGRVFCEVIDRDDTWIENRLDAFLRLAECERAEGGRPMGALLGALEYRAPSAELCCAIGREFYDKGDMRSAAFWYESALTAPPPEPGAFVSEECRGFLPCIMLCLIYYALGDVEKSCGYNETAAQYRPNSPYCIQNRRFFEAMRG